MAGLSVSNALSFQAATRADLTGLLMLMQAYYREDRLDVSPQSTRAVLENFFSALDQGQTPGGVWFLVCGAERVGYLALTWGYSFEYGGRVGTVDELYVEPSVRCLGRAALTFAETVCKNFGMKVLSLEVEPENEGARRLYLRFGFHNLERHFFLKRF